MSTRKVSPNTNTAIDPFANPAQQYYSEQKPANQSRLPGRSISEDSRTIADPTIGNQSVAFRGSDGRSLDIGAYQDSEDDAKSNSEEGKSLLSTGFAQP